MPFVTKMTASQQISYDATLCVLRHHFGDRRARWVGWELHDLDKNSSSERTPDNPVVDLKRYTFTGSVEVPRFPGMFHLSLACAVREMQDGTRYVFSVHSVLPISHTGGTPPSDRSLQHVDYFLAQRRPKGRSEADKPKFLRSRFALPSRRKGTEEE